jgi:ligand-binding sensor domain-containing protein/two-component sensor histidine kinase
MLARSMTRTTSAILAILCLLNLALNAQSHYRFDHLTLKDGLSQSQAYCFLQDSYGYTWIGTQDGLNRFDGYEFKVYKNNPFDSTTLTHNWIWAIEEDKNHDLWIGTFQGLCKYIRSEDRFQQYYHNKKDPTSISGNRTNFIIRDKKDRLWISCWGNGLNLYDDAKNEFIRFLYDSADQTSISSDAVRTLYSDHEGNIWVGTWNAGLNRVIEDESGIHFRRYKSDGETGFDAGKRITSITEDTHGTIWIGSYEAGLMLFDPQRNSFSRVPGFSSDDVNKVVRDSHGQIWIGSNSGLHIADPSTGKIKHFLHDATDPSGISSNTIYALYEDRNGSMWISGNGVDLYNPEKNVFKTFSHKNNNPNSLSQNLVWSFCEDEEGNIWIGTEAGPLNVFNPTTEQFDRIAVKDGSGNLAQNIRKIAYKDGVLWLATYGSGLVRYEKNTGKATFYLGRHPSILGKSGLVNEVYVERDGTLWVSTNENGLVHFSPDTDQVERFLFDPANPKSIGSNFINTVIEDGDGNIWVGFWGGGMAMLDKDTREFTNYKYDRKNPKGLSDQVVISIVPENDSIIWACTHTGLNRLNKQTGKFTHYFEKDGLPNNVVYEMLKDDEGNYWISTNKGLSKFNPVTKKFKNFTMDDGLQSNEFNSNAALRSSTGDFYFGGISGFNIFRPEKFKADTVPPTLVINSFKVFNQEYPVQEETLLEYHENYISFQFAAIEFSSPEKIRYAYRLEGSDRHWVDAGDRRFADYTDLGPGSYTFRVRATNADGYVSEGNPIRVVINPPFWKTWWFMLTSMVICASIIYSIHRYRLAQSLKVERLRNKIASDLHDEVGSSLTRISIYSDLVQSGTEATQSKNYLKSISEMSREIVSTMSDIVWSIDNRNDSTGALILRMKDFATEVLQAKNIEMSFTIEGVDENRTLDPALKQNIYLIFKESVNNIVKHADAKNVIISLVNRGSEFIMKIHDDGRGFPNDGSQKGNGLRNMHRRALAIGAVFSITTDSGTTITVTRKSL